MESWNDLPSGEIELTIESEAYLQLALEDLSKCEYEEARKELEIAVKSANPQAEYLLGYLYDHALGVDRDVEKVLFWYLRAAEHGYAPAQTCAAALYLIGNDVPTNYAEAFRLLSLAVHKEDPKAEFWLGLMYSEGLHVKPDLAKAVYWMEKSAQKECEAAIHQLAVNSAYGIGVNEVWAKRVVEHGEYYPLISVAQRYIDDRNASQNTEKGVSLLTELADKGIGSAQIALAQRLITGAGVPKKADKALHYLSLAADAGNAELVSRLGVSLYKGEGKNIDPDIAVKCLELAEHVGNVNALVELGNLYLDGAGEMPPDQEKAFRYFIQAAERDNPRGWEWAGYCLYEGKGTPQNREEALRWYEKAAEKELYNSYYMLGMIYSYDKALSDYEKAVICFEKSAELGQTNAFIKLGKIYLEGLGDIKPNQEKAFHYFYNAAKADNTLGCEWTAYCYYRGYGVQQNRLKALQFYSVAAEKGASHSQYMLGMLYGYDLTPHNYRKAACWFQKAAVLGHSDAQLKLGFYYHNGRGVIRNYKKAFALFEQAAAQGHTTAMHNIGDAFENGYGVKKDEKQAFAWYMKSAQGNDKWGMFAMGRLMYAGIGTVQNREEGRQWIRKAADAGLQDAIDWMP